MHPNVHFATSQSNLSSEDRAPGARAARAPGEASVPVAGVLGLVVLLEITLALLAS
jgi:hypothetical protein